MARPSDNGVGRRLGTFFSLEAARRQAHPAGVKGRSTATQECDTRSLILASITDTERNYVTHGMTGLPTGFKQWDGLTGGLQNGELIVVGGRPAMGKTSLALNLVEHAALEQKRPVAVFSLELTGKRVVTRLLCMRARINSGRLRRGLLSEGDITRLTNAADEWTRAHLHIVDVYPLTITDLASRARVLRAEHKVELIVIDHLQLLAGRERSRRLRELAKELDLPVLVLSPLNRGPEGRTGGWPRTSDLREASSLEADADVIALLLRHEYYAVREDERTAAAGRVSLLVAKQRQGPVGEIPLIFQKETMRFAEETFPNTDSPGSADPA